MFSLELWRKRRSLRYTVAGLLLAGIVIAFLILPGISWLMQKLPLIGKFFRELIWSRPRYRVTPLVKPPDQDKERSRSAAPWPRFFRSR